MSTNHLFQGFDFTLLERDDFLEDSVREELVVPLLSALGYSASPPNQIIRSLHLQHPYVYIGSVKKPISIIPDYLIKRDGENAWILDAKAPNEIIDSGKNVEQAYSYAIHPDVHVPVYALCNGRRLTIFHISRWPAIFDAELTDLTRQWPLALDLLGTRAVWPEGRRPLFLPDFGLMMRKAGLDRDDDGVKFFQIIDAVPIEYVARVQDDLYCATGRYTQEYAKGCFSTSMITFDFDSTTYQQQFLPALPADLRDRVCKSLTRQPFSILLQESEVPTLLVTATMGDMVYENKNESYCPLIAQTFDALPLRGF